MTKTVYKCEFCGKVHDEKEEACRCEESHVQSGEVALLAPDNHLNLINRLGRWPDKLVLLTKDHKAAIYGRTGDYVPTVSIVQHAINGHPFRKEVDAEEIEKEGE